MDEKSGLEKIVEGLKESGTDFNAQYAVDILDREFRKSPDNLSLPKDVTSRVELLLFLRDKLRLPEGRFFYRLWALVGESLPLQARIP